MTATPSTPSGRNYAGSHAAAPFPPMVGSADVDDEEQEDDSKELTETRCREMAGYTHCVGPRIRAPWEDWPCYSDGVLRRSFSTLRYIVIPG